MSDVIPNTEGWMLEVVTVELENEKPEVSRIWLRFPGWRVEADGRAIPVTFGASLGLSGRPAVGMTGVHRSSTMLVLYAYRDSGRVITASGTQVGLEGWQKYIEEQVEKWATWVREGDAVAREARPKLKAVE